MFLPIKCNCSKLTLFFFSLKKDKVALGAKPYKEEIEDLKMKLVKTDLKNMKIVKELEKEYVFALIEHTLIP